MVVRAKGHYVPTFKRYCAVTHRDPLSPRLFDVVVDAVIRHWVTLMVSTEEGAGGLGLSIRDLAAYFYADDGIVASIQPERLHCASNVITGLFNQISLRKNTWKMVSMACHPCHVPVRMSVEAYDILTTGTGLTFQERKRMQV